MDASTWAPLRGVRVLDFSWNVAGPICGKVLAALGADVVKVESHQALDPTRRGGSMAGFSANLNLGKRSVVVDAKTPEGHATLERLFASSDVVLESFASGTLEGWGFGFDRLVELSPRLVYVTITGFGHTGRYRSYVSYGPTAQAYSGLTFSSGLPDRAPAGWGYSYLDVFTGDMASAWALAALYRVRTAGGSGPERVDVSQVETGASLLGPLLLDYQVNGTEPRRSGFPPGNRAVWPGDDVTGGARGEVGAPYGIYPTAGESLDAFCAIAVLGDDEWVRLRACMGDPAWAMDPSLRTVTGRLAGQDSLDAGVAAWTRGFEKYELMRRLTEAGVRAGAVQSARDRLDNDPSLAARGVYQGMDLEGIGEHRFERIPLHVDGRPLPVPASWPVLGADTEAVLAEWAGAGGEARSAGAGGSPGTGGSAGSGEGRAGRLAARSGPLGGLTVVEVGGTSA